MKISKLDASRRQLENAIKLFFEEADTISIHTLSAAAHQILMDLGKPKGVNSILKGTMPTIIKENQKNKYLTTVNKAENFFKHANNDADGLLEFNSEQTEFLLFDAVEMYSQLARATREDMSIYRAWFFCKYPNIITYEAQNHLNGKNINYSQNYRISKQEFYTTLKSLNLEIRN